MKYGIKKIPQVAPSLFPKLEDLRVSGDHQGGNLTGLGLNIGVGGSWFGYYSYAITFSAPSRDFWLHPATRR